jgi:hypothetical protein
MKVCADCFQGIDLQIFEIAPLGKDIVADPDRGPSSILMRNDFVVLSITDGFMQGIPAGYLPVGSFKHRSRLQTRDLKRQPAGAPGKFLIAPVIRLSPLVAALFFV